MGDAPSAPQPGAMVTAGSSAAPEPRGAPAISPENAAAKGDTGQCVTLGELLRRMLRLLSRPNEVSSPSCRQTCLVNTTLHVLHFSQGSSQQRRSP